VPAVLVRALSVAGLLMWKWSVCAAHDIPADVVIQAFVRPEGHRLTVLVRVPLAAMRDFNFPMRDGVVLLDLTEPSRLDAMLREASRQWIVPALTIVEDGRPLAPPGIAAVRASLPSDSSFSEFTRAEGHMLETPLPPDTRLPWNQALFDVALEYPIASDRSRFVVDPQFARFGLRVVTVLRLTLPNDPERAFEFEGDPGPVALDPRWHQAALRFMRLGFRHILDGVDHLLFLFCLVLPYYRSVTSLVVVVTAFTVAHSITLAGAACGYAPDALWFPPLVETLIAASIVYMALENIVLTARPPVVTEAPAMRRRWGMALAFGLVHGFGFSFRLQEMLQFAGSHVVTSLFAFNLGVEIGQLLVLAVVVPVITLTFRAVVPERLGIIIASALAAHVAWHWMVDRGSTLGDYDWSASAAELATLARWSLAAVTVAMLVWLARLLPRGERS